MAERLRRLDGKALARGALALVATTLFLSLAIRERADADAAARLLPEGLHLPETTAAFPLEGDLAWNGSTTETLVFHTEASPEALLEEMRRQWEERPVEWFEAELPEGRALTVFDFHQGMRWTLFARRIEGGRTEAIRSLAPLAGEKEEEARPPFELLASLELVSLLEDRAGGKTVITGSAVEVERDERAMIALCVAASESGWVGDCGATQGDAGREMVELARGEERLLLHFVEGPFEKRWLGFHWEME